VDLHPDFRDLLAEFVRAGVRFVVVGGYAVGHHAKPRATKDLDLLVSAIGRVLFLCVFVRAHFARTMLRVAPTQRTRALGTQPKTRLGR